MKYILKKIIIFAWILSFIFIPIESTFSARLILPHNDGRQDDLNVSNNQLDNRVSNEWTIFEYIRIINSYLWFSIWWISMAILIYAGIQMITAWWDKWKVGKAWKLALYSLIWIVVAMVSYTIVNLIINLL